MTGADQCAQGAGLKGRNQQALGSLALASAAHALKNPLEAMMNLVYLLQERTELDQQAHTYVQRLENELQRMRQIIGQTLEDYRQPANPTLVSLSDVIDTILRFYDQKIAFKHIQVGKRYDCDSVLKAFSEDLRELFSNLVINALEALRLNGRLTVHIYESPDWSNTNRAGVRVVVADNGSGILREQRRKIFHRCFTTKGQKGTGLGLWVSAQIVHKQGGNIRFRSSTRRGRSGTVFSVFLPFSLPSQAPDDREQPITH